MRSHEFLFQNPRQSKELEGCDGIHCDSNKGVVPSSSDAAAGLAGLIPTTSSASSAVGPVSASASNLLARYSSTALDLTNSAQVIRLIYVFFCRTGHDSLTLPLGQQQQQQAHSHSCPSSPTETDCSSGFSTLRRRSVTLTEKVGHLVHQEGLFLSFAPVMKRCYYSNVLLPTMAAKNIE